MWLWAFELFKYLCAPWIFKISLCPVNLLKYSRTFCHTVWELDGILGILIFGILEIKFLLNRWTFGIINTNRWDQLKTNATQGILVGINFIWINFNSKTPGINVLWADCQWIEACPSLSNLLILKFQENTLKGESQPLFSVLLIAFICLLKLNYVLKVVECTVLVFHGIHFWIYWISKLNPFFSKIVFSISDPPFSFLDSI